MTYQETIDYLYFKLPFFQKQGAKAFKPKLEKIQTICHRLGNPEQGQQFIHVAGTNGKGSTSHMLSSFLTTHGFKTGLYTSPHLKSFTERIKIDGEEISENEVVEFVRHIKPIIEELNPSFFEVTVAMAFWYFKKSKVDYAVIEVGLGGRLDSTNIITPILSVITNISLDHQQYLGDTLKKIAFEKAGIIKHRVPVIVGEIQEETYPVFRDVALKNNAPVFDQKQFGDWFLKLQTHSYQDKNLQTALKVIHALKSEYRFKINEEPTLNALQKFAQLAGLKGRWQHLSNKPKIVCDTGHNEAGVKELVNLLHKEDYNDLHIIWGMVAEKEVATILSLLPAKARYYFCKAENERMLNPESLREKAKQHNLQGETFSSVSYAIEEAKKNAQIDDLIFIGGSTFVVAEIPFL